LQNVSTVQLTSNSAVVNWITASSTQGRVEYGTSNTAFTFSQLEGQEGTTHNVPLTLLTPNTTYYYVVNIITRGVIPGTTCTDSCVPWQFTTSAVKTDTQSQSEGSITPSKSPESNQLSTFCQALNKQFGQSKSSSTWASAKQYDLDSNGIINSRDALKCQADGNKISFFFFLPNPPDPRSFFFPLSDSPDFSDSSDFPDYPYFPDFPFPQFP